MNLYPSIATAYLDRRAVVAIQRPPTPARCRGPVPRQHQLPLVDLYAR